MKIKALHKELKRRNVYKGSLGYLAVSWILLQVFSLLLPIFEAPLWILKILTFLLFAGFPFWIVFSWVYDISPEGLKKIESEETSKQKSKKKKVLISLSLMFLITSYVLVIKSDWLTKETSTQSTIKPEDSSVNQPKVSSNLKAIEFHLKGEMYHKKESLEDINLAIQNYENAIKLDSSFALAYSDLASAYMRKNLSFDPDVKWEEKAYSLANIALLLDPTLANPHIIKGQFYWSPSHEFAHVEAINEFKKATDKNKNLSQAYEQLALVQLHIGLFDEALKNAETSIKLDPGNYRARRFIAEIFLFKGEYEKSLVEFEKIPGNFAPQPTRAFKALTHIYLGQENKALDILENTLIESPNSPHINSVYAILLASQGAIDDAKMRMDTTIKNTDDFIHAHHIYYYLGIVSILLDQKEQAVTWLEKTAATGFPNYLLFNSDPFLESLRTHPEFVELLAGLKKQWDTFQEL